MTIDGAGTTAGGLRDHVLALQAHRHEGALLLASVLLQTALLLPAVVRVQRELATFVTVQRTELAAGDQAAASAPCR